MIKAGLATTIQDLGRLGSQHLGMPVGGAMDREAHVLANRLVGNPPKSPTLEVTLIGASLRIQGEGMAAITGGDFPCDINGSPVPRYHSFAVHEGDILTIRQSRRGLRGYLSFAGKWLIPERLGSQSHLPSMMFTDQRDSQIQTGAEIQIEETHHIEPMSVVSLAMPASDQVIRIWKGPEYSMFSDREIHQLESQNYTIDPNSNRMGIRFAEQILLDKVPSPMISSPVRPGVIQMTRSGHLIAVMSDGQTIGGYHRVAVVHPDDYRILAQMMPSQRCRFRIIA